MKEMEIRMGRLLQLGVFVAGAVMAVGGVLYLVQHGSDTIGYGRFRALDPELQSGAGVLRGALAWHPAAIIQLGVLLMIATPVLRVAFAVFAFAQERDWRYTLISAMVLALLTYALLG